MPISEEDAARDQIIESARFAAKFWSNPNFEEDCEKRISGAIFTFLAELDGVGSLPACDIVVLHSDEDGKTIGETRVSTMLHEFFYRSPNRDATG